ncbi:gluconate:H+ symporter [Dactylosporangium sp. CA-092794]|uniref:GntT/GntP/DsdX family permease n=1 Tax=Dactylosporangium sp. CA-092794 TaxID=3239929 RepID=UPI003D916529
MNWTLHDTALVIWTLVAIAVIVVLITRYKIHPFLSLILGSAVVGLGAGLGAAKTISSFESGFGSTLGGVGILVALGTILGKLLADSGGADQVVDTIVSRSGRARLPWAMALIAMIIGIPLFFEVGVVLLIPVIFLVARRAQDSIVRVGIPALAGLSVMHGLVPPHPGPLIAISALHADLGQTLLYGLIVAIPTVVVAGPLYGIWVARFVHPVPPQRLVAQFSGEREQRTGNRPSFALTLFTVLLPVVLMLGRAIADITAAQGNPVRTVLDPLGDPFVALLLAVLVALFTFGYLRGFTRSQVGDLVGASLLPIAGIIFIIGAGGGFKQTLVAIGIGDAIGKAAAASGISALLLGWLIAVGIRLATGSATVATVTAAGLMAPLLAQLPGTNTALLALAIGSGSLFLSHVNDAGFWLVKEYFGMTVGETFKTWSAMETIISVVSIVLILLLGAFV